MLDADDKHEPGFDEVEDPDADSRDGATPADEDFAPTDEAADSNFGGPGISCIIRGGLDP